MFDRSVIAIVWPEIAEIGIAGDVARVLHHEEGIALGAAVAQKSEPVVDVDRT